MTEVYIEIDGNRMMLSAKGHATGSDVVCGIISAAVYGLAGTLWNAETLGLDVSLVTVKTAPGDALIICYGDEKVELLFRSLYIMLGQVAGQEPERLKVERKFL